MIPQGFQRTPIPLYFYIVLRHSWYLKPGYVTKRRKPAGIGIFFNESSHR